MPTIRVLDAKGNLIEEISPAPGQEELTIGRETSCHIPLEHPAVSRRHARIMFTKLGTLIVDEGSTNGTWVAGERVNRRFLEDGDRIRIGGFRLVLIDPKIAATVAIDRAELDRLQPQAEKAQGQPATDRHQEQKTSPCPACSFANTPDDRFCGGCGGDLELLKEIERCPRCTEPRQPRATFCTKCGAPFQASAPAPGSPPAKPKQRPSAAPAKAAARPATRQPQPEQPQRPSPASAPAARPKVVAGGRPHHPAVAVLAGVLIPGAGQAYNGQAIKGFFLLFASALVLPWAYSLFDAHRRAREIATGGGRLGRGGFIWILLQGWLFFNVQLLVVLLLTLFGVLA